MKKTKNKKITNLLMIFGISLICVSFAVLFVSQVFQSNASKNAQQIVLKMRSLMPKVSKGFNESYTDLSMPMLEINGENFIGIFEFPLYDITLPISEKWQGQNINNFPCRYSGSVYNDSLIIGGSDNKGQFDFMKIITDGDVLYITDVTGSRYSYKVDDIEITDDISTENLLSEKSDLVLFARSTYALNYTIVRCKVNFS